MTPALPPCILLSPTKIEPPLTVNLDAGIILLIPIFPLLMFISPELTLIPDLAVIIPIESTFVTSSYVNVPPTPMFPVTDRSPVIF